jgi:hypothetical protein
LWTDISRRSAYFSSLFVFVVFRFRASCVVVEFHSSHSFANLTANYSSFSCVYFENSTGFDVFNITVRFVLCFLCCCWVPLQPQSRQFFSDLLLIFVVFRENSTGFVLSVLLLSSTPATVSPIFHWFAPHFRSFSRKFDRFRIFVRFGLSVAVLLLSFTPATATPTPTPTPGHYSFHF